MRSFIAATLLFASIGFAAPPDGPIPKAPVAPAKTPVAPPNWEVRPSNKLPNEADEALKKGVKFILFSLNPGSMTKDQRDQMKPDQIHHDFMILGSTELVTAESRNSAITTLTDAMKSSDGSGGLCFSPRHSLRAIGANGKVYDFVTCFQCSQILIFSGEREIGYVNITGSQKPLDDILTAARIPLAKPMEGEK